jgi:tetratricopeptide (TPR) repeat protein
MAENPATPREEFKERLSQPPASLDEERAFHLKNRVAESLEQADDEAVASTLTRLRKFEKFPKGWQVALRLIPHLAVLVALITLVVFAIRFDNSASANALNHVSSSAIGSLQQQSASSEKSHPKTREEILLFSNPETDRWLTAFNEISDDDPSKVLYLSRYLQENENVPEEWFERARKLDPDNGWLTLFHAGQLAQQAVERNPKWKRGGKLSKYRILDSDSLDRAHALAELASQQPEFRPLNIGLAREALKHFENPKRLNDQAEQSVQIAGARMRNSMLILHLFERFTIKGEKLADNKDRESLEELMETMELLLEQTLKGENYTISTLVSISCFKIYTDQFAPLARSVGMNRKAEQIDDFALELANSNVWRKNEVLDFASPKKHGGFLAGIFAFNGLGVEGVEQPTLQSLEPGRMKWLLVFEQNLTAVALMLFAILSLFFLLASHLGSRNNRLLAQRLYPNLKLGRIVIWTLVAWALPILLYAGVTRLTPMGSLDWALFHLATLPFSGYWTASFLFAVAFALGTMAWQTRRNLASLGFASKARWTHWLPAVLFVFAFLSCGLVRVMEEKSLWVAGTFAAVAFLLGIGMFVWTAVGPRRNSVARILSWRATAFTLAVMSLLMLPLLPALVARETHWVQKETFSPVPGDPYHLSALEASFNTELRSRLREILQ